MDSNTILFKEVTSGLTLNKGVFQKLLEGLTSGQYLWKPEPSKWCLLEVVSHLYDEEWEDFRVRLKHVLDGSSESFQPIDPEGWVKSRKYMEQNYEGKLKMFLAEREKSMEWLKSLQNPAWDNVGQHPKFGEMSAKMFLSNWLAHDYLHIRQITRLKFEYLKDISGEKLDYAGAW